MLHLFSTADSSVLHTEHTGTLIKRKCAQSFSAATQSHNASHSMDNRLARAVYSQQKRVMVRGAATDMISTKSLSGKFNEKELMHGLNDRLAGFIEKVHQLEQHNHLLEREIEEMRGKAKPAACLEEEYGSELHKLRQLVQDIAHQKHQIEIEHQSLEEELSRLRRRYEQEARSRADTEGSVTVLKKDIDDAYQAKLQLDKKAQSLVDEIHFLKRNHEAEVSEMFDQIQDAEVSTRAHGFGHPGVTAALRDIRAQLEGHTASDVQHIGETFRSQFAKLTEAAEIKREAVKATQREIQEYRRRLQAKSIELDCAKGTREALERQLHDVEDRHKEEIIHYQNTIKELENELINCKFDMSAYLREYQDLLNVKMALDVEILSYRKLLCGEEARLSTASDSHISLPYIYHQSPTYTLPCFSRPGGPHRRVEPQYKFVEEIITETTREIEMSEFEETGSEETEVGKDEQQAKREGGGSSEEEEGGDNKDSGEEEGNQMSGGQQNQVAAEGNSVNKSDGESLRNEVETEKSEAADKDVAKNTQRKDVLIKEEDKQHKRAAETPHADKDVSVTASTVQPELSSKAQHHMSDIPVEAEVRTKSEVREEDHLVSAQAKESVEATSAKKTQEQSNVVQDPASKADEKTTESRLSTEAGNVSEKAQSSISKDVEVKGLHAKSKENLKSDAKSEDMVSKTNQDTKLKSNNEQDTEAAL